MAILNTISLSQLEDETRLDPQYYTPDNMLYETEIIAFSTIFLGSVALITDGQHGYFKLDEQSEIRQITAKCIKEGLVDKTNADRLSSITHLKNLRSSLEKNDVLVTTAGTIGQVGLVTDEIPPANIDQDIGRIAIHNSDVSPFFIWAFLQSKFGRFQIERAVTGQVQTHLSLNKMKKLRIPLLSSYKEVEEIVSRFLASKKAAKESYACAQQLLESELELNKISFQKPVGYTARFGDVVGNGRMDADYYQIKYKQLDDIAAKFPVKKIKTISEKLETGVYSKSYSADGRTYLRGVDINAGFIDGDSILRTKCLMVNHQNTVIKDDILVTRVGSIGVCAIIEDTFSGSFYSDNLIRIRLYDQAKKEISASYLNLLLNTTYGQMQMVRYSRGSVQQRLNQSQLAQIPLPIIRWERQLEIENLLKKHRQAKKESKHLLEQAKSRVEQLIEEAVKS